MRQSWDRFRGRSSAIVRDGSEKKSRGQFSFVGIEIGGWGALLSLLISIFTLGYTAVDRWFLFSVPVIVTPDSIEFSCNGAYKDPVSKMVVCPTDQYLYLDVAPVTFYNNTSSSHWYVVRRSEVSVTLSDSLGAVKKDIVIPWLYFDRENAAGAISVGPKQAVSKEIQYYPSSLISPSGAISVPSMNFHEFEKLLSSKEVSRVTLTFRFWLLGLDGSISRQCEFQNLLEVQVEPPSGHHVSTCVQIGNP